MSDLAPVIVLWEQFDPTWLRDRVVARSGDVHRWDRDFREGLDRGWHRQAPDGTWWYRVDPRRAS